MRSTKITAIRALLVEFNGGESDDSASDSSDNDHSEDSCESVAVQDSDSDE